MDEGLRGNKKNFTFLLDQKRVNRTLMENLINSKPIVATRQAPLFLHSRLVREEADSMPDKLPLKNSKERQRELFEKEIADKSLLNKMLQILQRRNPSAPRQHYHEFHQPPVN
jgi:hypothetical protein